MREALQKAITRIEELAKTKPIKVISHFDTDGITSAAITAKALQRWNKPFSLKIIKNLDPETIQALPEDHILLFTDLASGSLEELAKKPNDIFILDHHEIPELEEQSLAPQNPEPTSPSQNKTTPTPKRNNNEATSAISRAPSDITTSEGGGADRAGSELIQVEE